MKKIGDIMKDMGFNKDASDSVKEAFVRHLIKAATGVEVAPRYSNMKHSAQAKSGLKHNSEPEQMSFDFGPEHIQSTKKVS